MSYGQATRHAEMEAIDMVLAQWRAATPSKPGLSQQDIARKFRGCELYVTCEPCIMCASALSILGIFSKQVVSMRSVSEIM